MRDLALHPPRNLLRDAVLDRVRAREEFQEGDDAVSAWRRLTSCIPIQYFSCHRDELHGVSVPQFLYCRMVSISLPLCARYAGQLYGAVNEACT